MTQVTNYLSRLWFRYQRPDDLGPKELPVVKEEEEDEEEEEEEMETVVITAPEEKWDCETIISEFHFHLDSLCSISCNCCRRLSYLVRLFTQQKKHRAKILLS